MGVVSLSLYPSYSSLAVDPGSAVKGTGGISQSTLLMSVVVVTVVVVVLKFQVAFKRSISTRTPPIDLIMH